MKALLSKFGKKQVAVAAALAIAGGGGAFYMKSKPHAEAPKHDEHAGHAKPEEHAGHAKPEEHAGHAKPEEHAEHAKPEEHAEHAKPEEHAEHAKPEEHAGHAKPEEHAEHAKPEEHAEHAKPEEHAEHAKPEEHAEHAPTGILARIGAAWTSIQDKVDAIRRLDLENARLKLENAQLKLKVEASNFDCGVAQSRQLTEQYAAQLKGETGARVGRTLASIGYRAPTHLLPKQLHALAVTYLKAREYEKAAVIFTLLGDLPRDKTYKSAAHRVLTGTAWFRLKNYDMAEFYFDQALKIESEDALRHHAQARLWKAVIAHHRGKKVQSQYWMQELVDYHPRSPEARWVNSAAAREEGHGGVVERRMKKTEGEHGERKPAESHH